MADSPVQLRDSVRKIRKRVVSVIRRGSSSKNVKSRSGSVDADKHSHHDDSEHDHEHDHEPDSEHSHSRTNSAASSTHSLHKSGGSRPGSPQPHSSGGGLLASPGGSTHRRLSMASLGFPRSSSKKNKSKGESAPSSPPARSRTISTPGGASPIEPSAGKLSLPIPARPRTLSHPLAASPILPNSPAKDKDDNAYPRPGHERAASAPGTAGVGALASAASTLPVMASLHTEGGSRAKSPAPASLPTVVFSSPVATPLPQVVASPVTSPAAQTTPVPDVIAAPALDVFSAPTPKLEESGQPRDPATADAGEREQHVESASLERAPSRESSGHAREPLPREHVPAGVKRVASTIGSDMGWSMLEPTQEEDEPEEEGASKLEQAKKDAAQIKVENVAPKVEGTKDIPESNKIQETVKVEEVPVKVEEVSLQTEESGVKVDKDDAIEEKPHENRNSLMDLALGSSDGLKPLPSGTEGEEHHNGALVMSPEMSRRGTPAQQTVPEPTPDLAPSGIFVVTPPRETHPTWVSTVSTPPRVASPSPYPEFTTPPAQTGGRPFSPEQDRGAFSTPDYRALRSSASPGSSQFTDTPSRFSGVDASPRSYPLEGSTDLPPLPSGIATPPRPLQASESSHYPGDATPPPPLISDSFFHPRNVEKLNPRHFERSMSTMGVFGDAEPDAAGVQERLRRANASPRPSIDTSIHEMISPSVRGEENELRKLGGTELRDWYDGETRTPKTVRLMLPETEHSAPGGGPSSRPRSALSQAHTLEPAAEIQEPEAQGSPTEAQHESEVQPVPFETQIQTRPLTAQSQVQRQPDRAQVYTSVLSRLMSHMDRRSSLMARLATRLGGLGGVGGPIPVEKHPREWIAQALPSGKVYWAHRLVQDNADEVEGSLGGKSTFARAVTAAPTAESSSKVLVIPTPSAPQPIMLVTDLDMSDPVTHSGVNMFVDKNLQERDVDLPSGWEIWIHASGTGESLLDGSKAERWDEVSEAGSEPVAIDLGYGTPCVLVWTYVSHKRRRVGAQGPEDKFVVGEDAELDLEMERRYWAYVETHPAHADVNPRAVQEAIELLTWHYTDRLLAEKKRGEKEYIHVKPPFTPEESHEVLEFLKSVSADYSRANAVLKTRTVARVHVRTAEWRLAKLHAVADAVNLEVMSPSERLRRRRAAANPFVGFPLRTLASLLGLGIPYLYVDQPDEKVEDRQRMLVADASTNLMSALMLGASVSFLAIPDLEDIARLAGVAAAACSLGSLAAGIVRLRIPSFSGGKEGSERTEDEQEPRPSALRTFARSLPLVLSAYAGSALVAGLAAYSWRGQVSTVDDPFTGLYPHDSWRQDSFGGRWLGSFMRRDSGSGHGLGGIGLESSRQGWSEASSQGLVRLWGVW